MRHQLKVLFLPLAAGIALASSGQQAKAADRDIRISGFSTLGYGILVNKDESQKEYMSLSRRGSALRDTKIGLNLAFRMSDDIAFAAQMVARGFDFFGQAPANNNTIFDWYFLRYNPVQAIEIRAGRQPIPFSLLAETQDVGLVNPWVRPPVEVYSMAPVKSVTGIQTRYTLELPNSIELTAGAYAGQDNLEYGYTRESTSPSTSVTKVKDASGDFTSMVGGIFSATRDDFTVLTAILNAKMKSATNYPVTIATGQSYPATAEANSPFSAEQTFKSKSIGARWEESRFLLLTEARRIDFEMNSDFDLKGFYNGYYLTAGLHIGPIMPTVSFANFKSENTTTVTTFVPAVRQMVESKTVTKGNSTAKTVGINTQLRDNIVWKLECQQTVNHSSDTFGPFAMGLFPKKKAVTVSTSLDTVF